MTDERENHDIDREAEAHGFENAQPPSINIDQMVAQFQQQVHTIVAAVKEGEIDPLKAYASFKGIGTTVKDATPELEKEAMIEAGKYSAKTFSVNGVEFAFRNGSVTLDFEKDEVYAEHKRALKEREELLKLAFKSKDVIIDAYGNDVPKVPVKSYTKDSLSVSFKKKK